MSFDHLASIIFQKNQRVWSVNYMSLKPYFYIAIECYCFQSFKELLAFFATQFFDWGAKVRAVCIQTKFFFTFSTILFADFSRDFIRRTSVIVRHFFERIAKIQWDSFTTKFYSTISQNSFALTVSLLRTYFPFFQSGCKDNQM